MTVAVLPRCGVDLVHIGTLADLVNGGSPTFAATCWTDPTGAPRILLHGPASARAQALGIGQFAVSLSEDMDYAIAFVIAHAATDDRQSEHETPTHTEVDDGQGS